jgi:hypothetical protein
MAEYKNPNYNSKYFPPHVNSIEELQEFLKSTSADKPLGDFDAIPYLCSLIKRADSDDDVIYSGDGFDYDNHLSSYYKQLTAIGDGRVNFYEVWQYIEQNILPRAAAQREVLQTGGCTIIDDYLCDTTTGQKIKQFKNTCNVSLSEPITFDEISTTVNTIIQQKKELHADSFINYLKENYIDKGWTLKLIFYSKIFIFYIEATKNDEFECIKYYSDIRDYLSEKLNINLTVIDSNFLEFGSDDKALDRSKKIIQNFSSGDIPNYMELNNP